MQDNFEKNAMDKAHEVGGEKTFELLDNAVKRYTESLQYTETGGKALRSEIAGYRKALIDLYRAHLLGGNKSPATEQDITSATNKKEAASAQTVNEIFEARLDLEKKVTSAIERLADSYATSEETIALVLDASEIYINKMRMLVEP